MIQKYNKSPISLREGEVFIEGVKVLDGIKCEVKFTPDVWSGRQLRDQTESSRWLGYAIAGTITRRRSTPWLKDIISRYAKTKRTPEFTIQGIMNDENSDYYSEHGSIKTTVVGCILTGDLNLINLDSGGTVVEDAIAFKARDIV